jgi:hypothetical protein
MSEALAQIHKGFHGRVLFVDLGAKTHRVEVIDPSVYRSYLGGYGLGAWLMWKHFPPKTDALAPEACFAICSGLLTGLHNRHVGGLELGRQRLHPPAQSRVRRARGVRTRERADGARRSRR